MNELGVYQNIQDKLFEGLNTNTSSKARNIGQMIDMKIIQTSPVFGVGFSRYSELVPYIGMLLGEKMDCCCKYIYIYGSDIWINISLNNIEGHY